MKDTKNRPLRDLRISVTDKCNFRCTYCMPKEIYPDNYPFMKRDQLLSFEEIIRLATLFLSFGVEKIRLTGGEPLLRRELPSLIEKLSKLDGLKDIGLTTNGVLLKKYAKQLADAGLCRVNVSLDALTDSIFTKLNGRAVGVAPILEGIEEAKNCGLQVKVNMVVRKGFNDSEILPMTRYFKDRGITLRFIEFMDVGNSNGWKLDEVVTSKEIRDMIHAEMPIEPIDTYYGEVAKRYTFVDSPSEIGFISSVTETFCSSCTRARISAEGKLYTCLFATDGYDLRELLRDGKGDEEIEKFVRNIWEKRDDQYSVDRFNHKAERKKIEMRYIGG